MIIQENLINLNVTETDKEAVIRSLTGLAMEAGRLSDVETYVQAVLHRESEFSTAVGFGVAIPHGKTAAVTEPFLCFARVKDVDWNAMDGNTVDLVFMIGVPESEAGSLHLKILASLSRKLMKQDFRDGLRAAATPAGLIAFLEQSELGL